MNAESLRLYRDILRASRHFTWPNEKGELWRDVLRRESRKEFEAATEELPGMLDPDANEKYLLHTPSIGPSGSILASILANGLDERFSGTSCGTLYGKSLPPLAIACSLALMPLLFFISDNKR